MYLRQRKNKKTFEYFSFILAVNIFLESHERLMLRM